MKLRESFVVGGRVLPAPIWIIGPDVIEDEAFTIDVAQQLSEIATQSELSIIFKRQVSLSIIGDCRIPRRSPEVAMRIEFPWERPRDRVICGECGLSEGFAIDEMAINAVFNAVSPHGDPFSGTVCR